MEFGKCPEEFSVLEFETQFDAEFCVDKGNRTGYSNSSMPASERRACDGCYDDLFDAGGCHCIINQYCVDEVQYIPDNCFHCMGASIVDKCTEMLQDSCLDNCVNQMTSCESQCKFCWEYPDCVVYGFTSEQSCSEFHCGGTGSGTEE